MLFSHDQPADAAYLCLEGKAELRGPNSWADDLPVSFIESGRLIGDLSVINRRARQLDLVAVQKTGFLRIGAEELRLVIESDVTLAVSLLEAVAGHLTDMAELLQAAQVNIAELAEIPTEKMSIEALAGKINA